MAPMENMERHPTCGLVSEGILVTAVTLAMANLLGLAVIAVAILNLRFDLFQKSQRQLTKSSLGESPVMRFSNRYFASGFMIFLAIFWMVITTQR